MDQREKYELSNTNGSFFGDTLYKYESKKCNQIYTTGHYDRVTESCRVSQVGKLRRNKSKYYNADD